MFNKKRYNKQWAKDNPNKISIMGKKYNHSFKGRFNIYKCSAIKRGLMFKITFPEFLDIINQPCYYCGGEGYGIDRLDSSIGYLKDNITSCCSMCNYMKSTYTKNEFIERCIKISDRWGKYETKNLS